MFAVYGEAGVNPGNRSGTRACPCTAQEVLWERDEDAGSGFLCASLPELCELMISDWIDRRGPALCTTS